MLSLAYIFVVVTSHLPLRSFTFMSMCGMNRSLPVSVSSFPFPAYYLDTGTGSDYLNRTYVGPSAQPLLKQASRRLTPLHNLSPHSFTPARLHVGSFDHRQRRTQT